MLKLGELLKHMRVQSDCVSVTANAYDTKGKYYSFRTLAYKVDEKTALEECKYALDEEVLSVDVYDDGAVIITIKEVVEC